MHFYQDKSAQLPCILVYNSLYYISHILSYLLGTVPSTTGCHCTSLMQSNSGIHGRWQEIPVVESPSIRDLAVSSRACVIFLLWYYDGWNYLPKIPNIEFKVSVDGLSVESWIQMWIHCLLWCNFSFLNTNKMNMLDGKTLKLRDFCPPGIPQLSWHSKMRSKWRPQWFASLPTSNPGILENSLWKCVCKPVSNHMYQLLFRSKKKSCWLLMSPTS